MKPNIVSTLTLNINTYVKVEIMADKKRQQRKKKHLGYSLHVIIKWHDRAASHKMTKNTILKNLRFIIK